MATSNVPDLSLFLKQQTASCEQLREILTKATALLHVSLENDILETHPKITVKFYLWAIYDLVEQSRTLNEQTLNGLRVRQQQSAANDG
jgi:hypothetical protein